MKSQPNTRLQELQAAHGGGARIAMPPGLQPRPRDPGRHTSPRLTGTELLTALPPSTVTARAHVALLKRQCCGQQVSRAPAEKGQGFLRDDNVLREGRAERKADPESCILQPPRSLGEGWGSAQTEQAKTPHGGRGRQSNTYHCFSAFQVRLSIAHKGEPAPKRVLSVQCCQSCPIHTPEDARGASPACTTHACTAHHRVGCHVVVETACPLPKGPCERRFPVSGGLARSEGRRLSPASTSCGHSHLPAHSSQSNVFPAPRTTLNGLERHRAQVQSF